MMGLPRSVTDALDAVMHSRRALAYLQVDAELTLVGAGGDLENYGLGAVRLGEQAAGQAVFLEGLLPLDEAPFFMPSLEIGGGRAADLHFYQDAGCTWVLLLDATDEREQAARMQQKAYDMTLLQEKEVQLNRQLEAANAQLRATQRELESSREAVTIAHERLQLELAEAAVYVRSLLPALISQPFATDWRFVPSAALGGDAFGYNWIDPNHFALYLLDVCGHGIRPSLMSVAVLHTLQAASMGGVDFRDPGQVLAALNERYQMKTDEDLYFTLWYGVYQPTTRRLDYGCAGHPPAILVDSATYSAQLLKAKGLAIGVIPNTAFACETVSVPKNSRLYLFSDGAFEVERRDGTMMNFEDLLQFINRRDLDEHSVLDQLFEHLVELRGKDALEDDFCIMRFTF
jgi:phosphoserine phosphatase RsbU/P